MLAFNAKEFSFHEGKFTGREQLYLAENREQAAEHCCYTQNLMQKGWVVMHGRSVQHPKNVYAWVIDQGRGIIRHLDKVEAFEEYQSTDLKGKE